VAALAVGTLGFQSIDLDAQRAGGAELDRALRDNVPAFRVTLVATFVALVLLVVFAAGLRRALLSQSPPGSLYPDMAAAGCILTAAAGVVYIGLLGLMLFQDEMPPGALGAVWQLVVAAPAMTIGLAVSQLAVAAASLRHGALPRSLGWLSGLCLVAATAVVVVGIPFLAYIPGFVFLLVTGIVLARRPTFEAAT
jgi:hypothetical protein